MPVQIVYETHSTTVDNESGFATGHHPGHLSAAGKRQAVELGERRRHDGIDVVFSSDLRRAVETVEIAFEGSDLPWQQDPRLRECDYGDLNGALVMLLEPRRKYIDQPFPNGESYREVVERTRLFLVELASRYDGARVLLVAHSANLWALRYLLAGDVLEDLVGAPFTWQPGWEFELPTGPA
ncbi:histidine phosphatase family protein [Kribbella sp. NBC_01245]|uniref:histidine phosphatase family protein n=1 Tax=Kribbella sp. NBC_01245 TaxID=2903578 RepID=UPI002E2CCFB4|nr:histidine phosphatase family protein [Kribbella sp. NBC_01245]